MWDAWFSFLSSGSSLYVLELVEIMIFYISSFKPRPFYFWEQEFEVVGFNFPDQHILNLLDPPPPSFDFS